MEATEMQKLDVDEFAYSKDSIRTLTSLETDAVGGGTTPLTPTPTIQLTKLSSEWCREQAEKLL